MKKGLKMGEEANVVTPKPEDPIRKEVERYHELRIYQSSRGRATLFLILNAFLTTIYAIYTGLEYLLDVLIMLFLAFFIYKSKKWAIVVAMAYWMIARLIGMYYFRSELTDKSLLITICSWIILMDFLYTALRVENLRQKLRKDKTHG